MVRELPFELWQDTAIVLRLEVNGADAIVLLDSGATASVIDKNFMATLRLPPSEARFNVQTPTGATQTDGVPGLQLTYRGKPLCATRAVAYDLSPLARAHGAAIDLLLGRDFFEAFVVDVDFAERKLVLTPSAHFEPSELPKPLALARGARFERAVWVAIEGRAPVQAILDLGSTSPIMMSAQYAQASDLIRGKPTSTAATATMTGVAISTTVTLDLVAIGPITVPGVPAEIFQDWRSSEFPVSVGFALLSRGRLILDFAHDRIWLLDDTRLESRSIGRDRSGLGLAVSTDALVVMHVAKGGPAEAQGWQTGERIVSVDGVPVDVGFRSSAIAKWRQAPAGSRVTLAMADGSTRELTLRDFY